MPEICIAINKYEVSWVTWLLICTKFGIDPYKTKDIVLYVNRAAGVEG